MTKKSSTSFQLGHARDRLKALSQTELGHVAGGAPKDTGGIVPTTVKPGYAAN
jgi:hypothetical protein